MASTLSFFGPRLSPPPSPDEEREGRFGLLRASAIVILVLLALLGGVLWMLSAREKQRTAFLWMAEGVANARPRLALRVEEEAVRGGVVATRLAVAELDRAGDPGPYRSFWITGEEAVVEGARVRISPRGKIPPLEMTWFRSLSGAGEAGSQRQSLLPPEGAPLYYQYRGEEQKRVTRLEETVWAEVRSASLRSTTAPGPSTSLVTTLASGDATTLTLALGDRWEVEILPDGRLNAVLSRSPSRQGVDFDRGAPILTRSSLELSVAEFSREATYAGQVDEGGFSFVRVALRIRNRSPQGLRLDGSLLILEDGAGKSYVPDAPLPTDLQAGDGALVKLIYRIPPQAVGLRLRVEGEELSSGERGRPALLPLAAPQPRVGDVSVSGSLLALLEKAERRVEGGQFVFVATLHLMNMTEKERSLEGEWLRLTDLRWEHSKAVLSSQTPPPLPPWTPVRWVATFPIGPSLVRGDPTLLLGDPTVGTAARFRLISPDEQGGEADTNTAWLLQTAAVHHWLKSRELRGSGGSLLGWLGNRSGRAAEAERELNLARSLFPESGIFGEAQPGDTVTPP